MVIVGFVITVGLVAGGCNCITNLFVSISIDLRLIRLSPTLKTIKPCSQTASKISLTSFRDSSFSS